MKSTQNGIVKFGACSFEMGIEIEIRKGEEEECLREAVLELRKLPNCDDLGGFVGTAEKLLMDIVVGFANAKEIGSSCRFFKELPTCCAICGQRCTCYYRENEKTLKVEKNNPDCIGK